MFGDLEPNINSNYWQYMGANGIWYKATNLLSNPANPEYSGATIRETHASAIVVYNDTLIRVNGNGSRAIYRFSKN